MTTKSKKAKIKKLVSDMLKDSQKAMPKNIDKAINSGAIDVDDWDENISPMILPKCIATAILEQEATQYDGSGTSFEKQIKKEVKNIRYFI